MRNFGGVFSILEFHTLSMTDFYGLYAKRIRMELEIPAKTVAQKLPLATSNLSRIENGQQECSEAMFLSIVQIFADFDSDYTFQAENGPERKAEALQILNGFLQELASGSYAESLQAIQQFVDTPGNLHSYAYFEVLVFNQIRSYVSGKEPTDLNDLYELARTRKSDFLPEEFLYVIYLLKGLQAVSERDFEAADPFFEKAANLGSSLKQAGLGAIATLGRIHVLQAQMKPVHALLLINDCQVALSQAGAFRWQIQLEILIGKSYLLLHKYDLAEKSFASAETRMKQISLPNGPRQIAENRAWMYLEMGNDQASLDMVQQARLHNSKDSRMAVAKAWSTWHMQEPKKAAAVIREELSRLSKTGKEGFIRFMLLLLRYYITDNERLLRSTYDKLMAQIPLYKDLDAELLIHSLMSDYYAKRQDFKQAIVYEKKKAALLKK